MPELSPKAFIVERHALRAFVYVLILLDVATREKIAAIVPFPTSERKKSWLEE